MKKILAGNWKMNKTRSELRDFFAGLPPSVKAGNAGVRSIVACSPTLMESAVNASAGTQIEIFSQNCAFEKWGALTGEISPLQLEDLGVRGTLIGHSERRQFFGDNDLSCLKRALCALENGLHVIYCIGETLEERKAHETTKVLARQLSLVVSEILPHLGPEAATRFVVAYEPVWAIGTGLRAGPQEIKEAHDFITLELKKGSPSPLAILYGGSVKADNVAELTHISSVHGALVGGASLKHADFEALHRNLSKA